MKQALMDLWLQALASGQYKQVKNTLHMRNGHCCLGVLTHVMQRRKHGSRDYRFSLESGSTFLSVTGLRSAGMSNSMQAILASINDKFFDEEKRDFSRVRQFLNLIHPDDLMSDVEDFKEDVYNWTDINDMERLYEKMQPYLISAKQKEKEDAGKEVPAGA